MLWNSVWWTAASISWDCLPRPTISWRNIMCQHLWHDWYMTRERFSFRSGSMDFTLRKRNSKGLFRTIWKQWVCWWSISQTCQRYRNGSRKLSLLPTEAHDGRSMRQTWWGWLLSHGMTIPSLLQGKRTARRCTSVMMLQINTWPGTGWGIGVISPRYWESTVN